MADRTERCTPAERALLNEMFREDLVIYRPDDGLYWYDCPFCGYDGLGAKTPALRHAFAAVVQERTGEDLLPHLTPPPKG